MLIQDIKPVRVGRTKRKTAPPIRGKTITIVYV